MLILFVKLLYPVCIISCNRRYKCAATIFSDCTRKVLYVIRPTASLSDFKIYNFKKSRFSLLTRLITETKRFVNSVEYRRKVEKK